VTRIDFHFNVDHRVHYACRVTRKARTAGKRMVVYARSAERLAQYDASLWTFSALDFLPHVYVNSPLAAATPGSVVTRFSTARAARRFGFNITRSPGFTNREMPPSRSTAARTA